jgi:hypothetical protein
MYQVVARVFARSRILYHVTVRVTQKNQPWFKLCGPIWPGPRVAALPRGVAKTEIS